MRRNQGFSRLGRIAGMVAVLVIATRLFAQQSAYVTDRYYESFGEPSGTRILEIDPATGDRRVASGPIM